MANVAEKLVELLVQAGVQRVYGVVGDSLNSIVDAVRRTKGIEWIAVRHEEVGAFAAGSALKQKGPALVDVVTNPYELRVPPRISGEQARGFSLFLMKEVMLGNVKEVFEELKTNIK
jgi:thiamine pyrophosphate-dependent acetolactate synthase large subunit-like protein